MVSKTICTFTAKAEAETLRTSFRRHLRDESLRTAYDLTIEKGWERVRVAEIASLIGVSRPMLYKELGDKQGLGDALVVREAERFLVGIQEVLDAHVGQAAEAIIQSIRFSLDEAEASPLRKAVLTASRTDSEREIDVIELNEAFAAQVLACLREWKVDPTDERLNPNGSGISLGHPVGATGGRILATMAHEMQRRGSRYGLETMCIGGGQGLAAIFEAVR